MGPSWDRAFLSYPHPKITVRDARRLKPFCGPIWGPKSSHFRFCLGDQFFDNCLTTFGVAFVAVFAKKLDPKLDSSFGRLLEAVWSRLERLLGCLGALL